MEWLSWILVLLFLGTMLALFLYSVISISLEIRQKAQPFIDSFFDGLYGLFFFRKPAHMQDKPRHPKVK
jgi:hypothetical protein